MVQRQGKLWLLISALLALGATIGWYQASAGLDWQPGQAAGQPWRWWTAAFVHFSALHLLANLAGVLVVAALGRVANVPAVVALAWAASWPLTHLALLLRPDLLHYGGLSGVLHAGVAAAATFIVRRGSGRTAWIGWALLAGLAVKIALEAPWGPALRTVYGSDIAVAPLAHATGALCGLLCAWIGLARDARPRDGPSSAPAQEEEPRAAERALTDR